MAMIGRRDSRRWPCAPAHRHSGASRGIWRVPLNAPRHCRHRDGAPMCLHAGDNLRTAPGRQVRRQQRPTRGRRMSTRPSAPTFSEMGSAGSKGAHRSLYSPTVLACLARFPAQSLAGRRRECVCTGQPWSRYPLALAATGTSGRLVAVMIAARIGELKPGRRRSVERR